MPSIALQIKRLEEKVLHRIRGKQRAVYLMKALDPGSVDSLTMRRLLRDEPAHKAERSEFRSYLLIEFLKRGWPVEPLTGEMCRNDEIAEYVFRLPVIELSKANDYEIVVLPTIEDVFIYHLAWHLHSLMFPLPIWGLEFDEFRSKFLDHYRPNYSLGSLSQFVIVLELSRVEEVYGDVVLVPDLEAINL